MNDFGLQGNLYLAIKSIYSSSSACVKLNQLHTPWFDINSGVKQGDTLSPTLFSMYLNDLAREVKELNCGVDIEGFCLRILLYADDLVLIAPDEDSLQRMLNQVASWCKRWRMLVNTDKMQVVHFRKSRQQRTSFSFSFNGAVLDIVPEYKYLGVYFDEHMSFSRTTSVLAEASSRALGSIRYKLKYLKECRCSTFTTLFSYCVCPIIDYGSAVWGVKKYEKLEQVQYKAMRYFLGVHRFAPIDMLKGDFGWLSCHSRHRLSMLRLWNRLVSMPTTRVTSKIFMWDLSCIDKSMSWSNNARNVFNDIGAMSCLNNLLPCDLEYALAHLKTIEEDQWNTRRSDKPKLRFYNMFKPDFNQEDYLNLNVHKFQRSLFAQFRAGILPLQVEVGRYRDVPLSERLCTLCDTDLVEDEFHLLCVCTKYSDLRCELYEKATQVYALFSLLDDLDKFVFLVSNLQKAVIVFLTLALSRRRSCLY